MWIRNRFSFFVLVSIFWLAACIPVTGQENPSPMPLPTETATPVAEENEFITYQNTKNKFEITYSKEKFTPDEDNSNANQLILVMNVDKLFPGQNLENIEVRVSAGVICQYKDIYYQDPEKETINGIDFSVYSTRDAGTFSNVFETLTYQTFHNGICYEIHLSIREYSLTAFPELSEYDPEIILIEFKTLLNTFKFIE
jgi:hypothetical protein